MMQVMGGMAGGQSLNPGALLGAAGAQFAARAPDTISTILDELSSQQARVMDILLRLRNASERLAGVTPRGVDNAPSPGFPQHQPSLIDRLGNQRDGMAALLSEVESEIGRIERAL